MSIRGAMLVLVALCPSVALGQSPAGGPFRINSYVTGHQMRPVIAADPAGGFTVVWEELRGGDFGFDVLGQSFDRTGARRGGEFRVNAYTTHSQSGADIATDGRGNLVVVWGGMGPGGNAAIYGQRFGAGGSRRGAEFRVSTSPLSGVSTILHAVASNRAGNFLVVWNNGHPSAVFGQSFASSAPPWAESSGSAARPRKRSSPMWRPTLPATSWWSGTATRRRLAAASRGAGSTAPVRRWEPSST